MNSVAIGLLITAFSSSFAVVVWALVSHFHSRRAQEAMDRDANRLSTLTHAGMPVFWHSRNTESSLGSDSVSGQA